MNCRSIQRQMQTENNKCCCYGHNIEHVLRKINESIRYITEARAFHLKSYYYYHFCSIAGKIVFLMID